MSDSDNDNDNLAPKTREIDVTAEMEALREREPGKVELAAKIAEEIRKEVGFEHNIRFEDGEFVLVASRRINDTQALEGEVTRAATVEGIVDHIIANDGHRIGYPPVNENAPGAGRAETESAARTVPPDPEGMTMVASSPSRISIALACRAAHCSNCSPVQPAAQTLAASSTVTDSRRRPIASTISASGGIADRAGIKTPESLPPRSCAAKFYAGCRAS